MYKVIFLFSFLFFFSCNNNSSSIVEIERTVKLYQNQLVDKKITGSNTFMLYKDGKIQFSSVVNSGRQGDADITDETIFPIWSMSKPITIVAMMLLHEDGKYDFNDNVSKYIPNYKNLKCKNEDDEVYSCKNELKIIHLLTHTSGYRYYSEKPANFSYADTTFSDLDEYIDSLIMYQPVEFEPGERYRYGINQLVLGRLVEVLSGKTFYGFLKERLFDPLEMNKTKFYLTENDRKKFHPLYNKSPNGDERQYTANKDGLTYREGTKMQYGGEGLVSTMSDYSKFCQMLVNNGDYNGNRIMKKSSIEKMIKPYTIENMNDGYYDGVDYAFSFFNFQEPILSGTNASKGIYGWSGAHNTHFWIDPKLKLFGLFMSRTRPFSWDISKNLISNVYSNL